MKKTPCPPEIRVKLQESREFFVAKATAESQDAAARRRTRELQQRAQAVVDACTEWCRPTGARSVARFGKNALQPLLATTDTGVSPLPENAMTSTKTALIEFTTAREAALRFRVSERG